MIFEILSYYDIMNTLTAFIIFNILYSYFSRDNSLLINMNQTLFSMSRQVSAWKTSVCHTFRTGLTIAKYSWIFLKFKYLRKKPVVPVPTIVITPKTKTCVMVDYTYKNTPYRLLVNLRRGPSKIIEMRDGDTDVTSLVTPYLGPGEDFHGQSLRPSDMGLNELIILDVLGEERVFTKDQVIDLNF